MVTRSSMKSLSIDSQFLFGECFSGLHYVITCVARRDQKGTNLGGHLQKHLTRAPQPFFPFFAFLRSSVVT
jgi:hypothetical protein